jgi:hypothetical protein
MKSRRTFVGATLLVAAIIALGVGQRALDAHARRAAVTAPTFEVDPFWPKPLPNHWVLGNVIGVGVDARDHVFVVHRVDTADSLTTCCTPAPPIIEFDPQGNVVTAWGGPHDGYVWPLSNHGVSVDNKGNIWIGGNGRGDSHILKFTHDGHYLATIGVPNQPVNSNSTEHFGQVAKISFDFAANEAYIADGYGNHRVAVVDMDNGKVKRFWGAYGHVPSDSNLGPYNPDAPIAQQFRNPVHCAEPSTDGLLYVCDRPNDRIQVFKKDGSFVKEKIIAPKTGGDGSVWDIAFSKDAAQKYIYLADGKNEHVYVIDRQSLEILTMFGDGGRQPGQWFAVHSIATDSKGNIYTTETYEGKRIQKFVYQGLHSVSAMDQGVVWPKK